MRTGLIATMLWAVSMLALPGTASAQYGGGLVVRCESIDYRDNYCPVNTRGGVRIINQISKTACYEGESWGFDRRGIWVTNGCAAEFAVGGARYDGPRGGYGGGYGGPARGGRILVCESRDYRYNYCPVRVRRDVDLVNQISNSECRQGRTWGYDRNGIWVDRGCGAEFAVD